jgi:uncharacterized membrane protein YcaP (DUF421 family)
VHIDWIKLFAFDTPIGEILVRGTVTYFAILVMLRVVGRRETGTVGITNLLTIVLLADAAQNAMAGDYTSIPDGVLLVGTIVFWSWFIDWAKFRSPGVARLIDPPALPLVKDGRLLARNMRIEMITDDELMSQLRLQGVDDLGQVKRACIESDGRISVVPRDGKSVTSGNNQRRAA